MADNIESLKSKVKELQKEIAKLKSSIKKKKFGLVWLDVPESFGDEYENALPVLKEVPDKAVVNDDDKPTHILIEGDNYHALTCLNYTHKGKIDVIYIDPPYNTGAKDWKYNNNYVDENDPWRHSKWINFMANRLRIAKNLLKRNGVLICAIDENEQAGLGLLLEEMFPKYKIDCIAIIHNPGGIQGNNFSYCHEYAYFVYPNNGKRYIELEGRIENADIRPLRDVSKGDHLREDAANCFYPILVKDSKIIGFGDVCEDSFHPNSANVTREDGDEQFVSDKGWYVFNANYGTSEEKAFVRMLDRQMNKLKERYDGIYLIRNEKHFKIHSFSDGQAFEPDFVLFLRDKNGNTLTYQIFIEPKGKHLKEYDKWKEDFLKQINEKFKGKILEFKTQRKTQKYTLVGVPFYNNEDENKFKQSLFDVLEN